MFCYLIPSHSQANRVQGSLHRLLTNQKGRARFPCRVAVHPSKKIQLITRGWRDARGQISSQQSQTLELVQPKGAYLKPRLRTEQETPRCNPRPGQTREMNGDPCGKDQTPSQPGLGFLQSAQNLKITVPGSAVVIGQQGTNRCTQLLCSLKEGLKAGFF